MRHCILSAAAAAVAVCGLGATAALAQQLLFGYETGEPGLPYTGNPGLYSTALVSTAPPVTQGSQALAVSLGAGQTNQPFGGPSSAAFTDAGLANAINTSDAVFIDMTVPDPRPGVPDFNFGNIDLTVFQTGIRPGGDADETGFSGTFALSDGQTITLTLPLTNTQFGTPHLTINPAQPWSYQIDLSFGRATGNTGALTFGFDNLRTVPEPASLAGLGLAGLLIGRRRA